MAGVDTIGSTDFSPAKIAAWFAPFDGAGRIALGVSGGGDSVALMVLAQRWQMNEDTPKITVLSVNHDLRSEAADEAAQAGVWARALGFDHVVLPWVGKKPDRGVQAAAREARYELMLEWCGAHGVRHLGLAHNLDDQAETLLMRLARGSGLDGLAAMARVSYRGGVVLVRPLLEVPGADLRVMLTKEGQPWLDDPSNQDDKYERVRVRKLLENLSAIGLGREQLAVSARRLGRARAALDHMAGEVALKTVTLFDAGFCVLNLKALADAPQEIGLRVLKSCLMSIGAGMRAPRLERLEALYDSLQSSGFTTGTLAGCKLAVKGDIMIVSREMGRTGLPEMRIEPGETLIWDRRFEVVLRGGGEPSLTVRALGDEGRKILKDGPVMRMLPAALSLTLPSFWFDGALLAVPHLDFYAKQSYVKHIDVRFCARGNLGEPAEMTPDRLRDSGIFTKWG